ncbi:MAG: glutamate--cysteine ligase [Phycisphaerae bacterium]|nr:glutamate--cysteine ligase [Phycisphaerae bacterium]
MTDGYHLFERFGVELEYAIVGRDDLDVLPVCDEVIRAACGAYESEIETGALCWSNELVLHVIELKTNGPADRLEGLAEVFQSDVCRINALLGERNACLMPTAMHPWMDPATETKLWPHEYNAVYEAFNRVFGCQGHGWSNLQSTHLNLPFSGDEEFGRLHAAIRLLMPIMPALAASSPIAGARRVGSADGRMEFYRHNARRIPSVTGRVIPEPVFSARDYEDRILGPMYRDIAPYDPEGILQDEWLNARGAIARFERDTIEIRVLDIQECPKADLAILALIVGVLRALVEERWVGLAEQRAWTVEPLETILLATIDRAEEAVITDAGYLRALGVEGRPRCSAGQVWGSLFERALPEKDRDEFGAALETILARGTLSRRILRALGSGADGNVGVPRGRLVEVYRELCECLGQGRMFCPCG